MPAPLWEVVVAVAGEQTSPTAPRAARVGVDGDRVAEGDIDDIAPPRGHGSGVPVPAGPGCVRGHVKRGCARRRPDQAAAHQPECPESADAPTGSGHLGCAPGEPRAEVQSRSTTPRYCALTDNPADVVGEAPHETAHSLVMVLHSLAGLRPRTQFTQRPPACARTPWDRPGGNPSAQLSTPGSAGAPFGTWGGASGVRGTCTDRRQLFGSSWSLVWDRRMSSATSSLNGCNRS